LECRPPYLVYLVRFQQHAAERSTEFKVVVNPITGRVEDFSDIRDAVPT
jgi:hypothetical protein